MCVGVRRHSRVVDAVNSVVELDAARRVAQLVTRAVEIQRRHFVAGVTLELVLSRSVQPVHASKHCRISAICRHVGSSVSQQYE